jgi:hypothetical protein
MIEVQRRHRRIALCGFYDADDYREIHNGADYVDRGDVRGIDPRVIRWAKSLARESTDRCLHRFDSDGVCMYCGVEKE